MTTNNKGEVHLKCGAFEKQFTLTWEQKGILLDQLDPPRLHVLVAGPPGTGKTTVLMCKGLQWLKQGKDVLVCSIHKASVPTSWYLHTLLSEAKRAHDSARCPGEEEGTEWGQVKYCNYTLPDAPAVQNCLNYVVTFKSPDRPMNLLFDYMQPEELEQCRLSLELVKLLKERLPESEIWASDWYSTVPEGFYEQCLFAPLRFTKQIFPHIEVPVQALELTGKLPGDYTFHGGRLQAPSGPDILHLRHKGQGADDKWPINSYKCGQRVAKLLRRLGVGCAETTKEGSTGDNDDNNAGKGDHYQFRDVLVITRNDLKRGETPAFARGLESSGIPTKVFGHGDYLTMEEALSDVILAPEDKVIVTNNEAITGMDRKVVVSLTGVGKNETWEVTTEEDEQIRTNQYPAGTVKLGEITMNLTLDLKEEEKKVFREKLQQAHRSESELVHRLTIWTRCTRQLVVVHLPEKVQGLREFKMHGDRKKKCVIM